MTAATRFPTTQLDLLGGVSAGGYQGTVEIRYAEIHQHQHYHIGELDPKKYSLLEQRVNDLTRKLDLLEQGSATASSTSSETEQRFAEFAERWRRETAVLSNVHRIVLHPAYQRIIGLGPDAIPFILKEISQRPGHWFWALHAITGEDPAKSGATFKEAVEAWLNWGSSKGYI